jgi:hypothetical protein
MQQQIVMLETEYKKALSQGKEFDALKEIYLKLKELRMKLMGEN